jgi:hypothetical protein
MKPKPEPLLRILVLTEDGSRGAQTTIEALLRKTFELLVPGTGTHKIRFEPQSERERRVMVGNGWKDRKHRELVDLVRSIATKLLEDEGGVPGFVVFHFDGDRPWSKRAAAENPALFEQRVAEPVHMLVRDTLARLEREAELPRRLRRLVRLVPFYSIEAWLFQDLDQLRRHCCGAPEHVALLDAWLARRSSIDEVDRPKEALACVGSSHNFSAEKVMKAGASYEAAVTAMLEAEDLLAALKATTERAA